MLAAILSSTLASPIATAGGFKIDCPDPIREGESATMKVRKPGYEMKWVYAFTYLLSPTQTGIGSADESDFEPYHGEKIKGKANSNSLYIPIVTKQDDRPEKNEIFEVGFWGDEFHGCEVKILDDDMPGIANVEITSKPARNFTYRTREAIDVTVTFSSPVETDNDTLLSLFVGEGDRSTWRGAGYHHGNGSHRLTFRYRVQPQDIDYDGVSVASASMDIDRNPTEGFSGDIFLRGTDIPVDYEHSMLPSNGKHRIDGRPIALSTKIISSPPDPWIAYRANQTIEVEFNYNVDVKVEGDPTVGLYVGWDGYNGDDAWREARYLRGTGTDTLVFGYTVKPGDNEPRGIAISIGMPGIGYGGEGTIKARGTDVERNPNYLGSGNQSEHKVDTTPPSIQTVTIESDPHDGVAYDAGEVIRLRVDLSEEVIVTGGPHLNLDIGGVSRMASIPVDSPAARGTFVDHLVFEYQVQPGDDDRDGIGLFAKSLMLNSGTIRDKAGIGIGLNHPAVTAQPGQKVDTGN